MAIFWNLFCFSFLCLRLDKFCLNFRISNIFSKFDFLFIVQSLPYFVVHISLNVSFLCCFIRILLTEHILFLCVLNFLNNYLSISVLKYVYSCIHLFLRASVLAYVCCCVRLFLCNPVLQYVCACVCLYFCMSVFVYVCSWCLFFVVSTVNAYSCVRLLFCSSVLVYACFCVWLYFCMPVLVYVCSSACLFFVVCTVNAYSWVKSVLVNVCSFVRLFLSTSVI